MENSGQSAERFARTFAPERQRPPLRRQEYLWLVGVVLVLAAVAILVAAWFAYHRNLPATGPLAMRPSPGLTVAERRDMNAAAAPFVAVSSLPLLGAGVWMLLKRPSNSDARAAAIVAAVAFGLIGALTSAVL